MDDDPSGGRSDCGAGGPVNGGRIRALVVDDEPLARRALRQLFAGHADVEVAGECADGISALAAFGTHAPDVVFLDIQMPGMDGFSVVRAARDAGGTVPLVVFLTAYSDFALDAFELDVVDYLVKPVADDRFGRALERVRRRLGAAGLTPAAVPAPAPPAREDQFVVPSARGQAVITYAEVDWIGADDYYAVIHTGGRRYLLRDSLSALDERLRGSRFLRVHRGAIVNMDRVRHIGQSTLTLRDGTSIPVSRRRRPDVVRAVREGAAGRNRTP